MEQPNPQAISTIHQVLLAAEADKVTALSMAMYDVCGNTGGGRHRADVLIAALAHLMIVGAKFFSEGSRAMADQLGDENALVPTPEEVLLGAAQYARLRLAALPGDAPLPWRSHIHEPGRA